MIKYKVNCRLNNTSLKQPSDIIIQEQLKSKYSTNQTLLYTGPGPFYNLKYRMKFYVQGPGPVDREKQHWEDAILLALNKSCGMYIIKA